MNINKLFLAVSALIIVITAFSSCRFDYEGSMMAEDLAEEVPDTILRNFSQVMVRDSVPTFLIEADESMSFGKRKETVFTGVHFQEYDKTGIVVTDGYADNARLFSETENVELWGSLNFFSEREEASLEGEYLFWDNEASTLAGKAEDQISLLKKSGSEISGRGFFADSMTKSIKFSSSVSGSWMNE